MRTLYFALLALMLTAPCALADTATIGKKNGGISISISGASRKKSTPQKTTRAPAQKTTQAENTAPAAGGFPPGMHKLLTPEQQARAEIIAKVMADYSSRNHYSEFTETQCKQMSEAIWYRLTTRRIPVRIAGGNVDTQCTQGGFINYLGLANHAWVMAALSPGFWIALETTNGTIISQKSNPLYYTSAIYFDRPEDVYRFDGLRRAYVEDRDRISRMKDKWNADAKGKRFRKGSELHRELLRRAQEIDELGKKNHDRLKTLEKKFLDGIFLH